MSDNNILYGCITTYSGLQDNVEELTIFLEFVNDFISSNNIDTNITIKRSSGKPSNYMFESDNVDAFRKDIVDENIDSIASECNFVGHDKANNIPIMYPIFKLKIELKRKIVSVKELSFVINRDYVDETFVESFIHNVGVLNDKIDGNGGYVVDELCSSESPYERYGLGVPFVMVESDKKLEYLCRGAYGIVYLGKKQIDALGGKDIVSAEAPVFTTYEYDNGTMLLQLSEDIYPCSHESIKKLRRYLHPILMKYQDVKDMWMERHSRQHVRPIECYLDMPHTYPEKEKEKIMRESDDSVNNYT